MAPQTPAMTPEDATAAIRDVREYRQNLTGRAAGLVWMIWGFALALFAAADMASLLPAPDTAVEGWSTLPVPLALMALPFVALIAGAVATNTVWKSHALETGTKHRAWIAWLGVVGLLVAMVLAAFVTLGLMLIVPPTSSATFVWLMPTAGAIGAVMISLLQVRRVKPWAGLAAAAFLLVLQFGLPPLLTGGLDDKIATAVATGMLAILVSFVTVGLVHYRRG